MNPHTMSVNEIAAQATTTQIIAGIDRATQGLMTGTQTAGWVALLAKLNEALRIQVTPRTIQAPAATYRSRHASTRAEYIRTEANGLVAYRCSI
jgi:hypothetical protein